jgi:hypothetical protein
VPITTAKSVSVTEEGVEDGWSPTPGFLREMDPMGQTRLVVSVPVDHLKKVHRELAECLVPPIGVLYRQVVDRRDPQPQGAPPRDFVALEKSQATVLEMLDRFTELFHHDARCELWLRGAMKEQLVLDADGLLFCYPDDPVYEDVLMGNGLQPDVEVTIVDRDYAKHLFHASNDALEEALVSEIGLVAMPTRR